MAKVKTAKQRITDFLKAKGYDVAEIQDAFLELDAADADLDKLAEVVGKNNEWVSWYQQITPALQEIVNERDSLKQRIQKLEAAGLTFGEADAAARASMNQGPASNAQNPNFDPQEFQNNLTRATNTLMKDVARYGIKHYREFNEDLDYDQVEKLMGEKNVPFDVAYDIYTRPKVQEKQQKEYDEKLRKGIQEGIQAEASKQGIRRTRKRTDDVEPAPLDKPAPPDADLKEAFLRDLDPDITH